MKSPSVWRVWIEMFLPYYHHLKRASPSVWRVWIEIGQGALESYKEAVTLRVEGVD